MPENKELVESARGLIERYAPRAIFTNRQRKSLAIAIACHTCDLQSRLNAETARRKEAEAVVDHYADLCDTDFSDFSRKALAYREKYPKGGDAT